ncbi:hypothetical protein ACLQ3C_00785 [Gordonia sp. DT30]|uniref:hypothetical protein n=1 Tax=Gordonia sp. DT30 TaxID=3416546 RepID=UPI003CF3C121
MAFPENLSAAELLARTGDGALLYGLTPPRATATSELADAVAEATLARLRSVAVDGLVLYDVDAEADRTSAPRPFPFMPMMEPAVFLDRHLTGWDGPVIVYRAVSKYTPDELGESLSETSRDRVLTVLVGAASRDQMMRTTLAEAYDRHAELSNPPRMGGVVIAERHTNGGGEHQRMLRNRMPVVNSSSRRSATTWTAPVTCCPTTPTHAGTRVWIHGRWC